MWVQIKRNAHEKSANFGTYQNTNCTCVAVERFEFAPVTGDVCHLRSVLTCSRFGVKICTSQNLKLHFALRES
eukprot:5785720-Amphidinium_carterae.1